MVRTPLLRLIECGSRFGALCRSEPMLRVFRWDVRYTYSPRPLAGGA